MSDATQKLIADYTALQAAVTQERDTLASEFNSAVAIVNQMGARLDEKNKRLAEIADFLKWVTELEAEALDPPPEANGVVPAVS